MLDRYEKIVRKEVLATHLLTKRLPVEVGSLASLSEDELWCLHDKAMKKFKKLKAKKVSSKKPPKTSLFDLKLEIARRILSNCHFCERRCEVNRDEGEEGWCKVGKDSYYASEFLHMGEEAELVPSHTIFFAGCTFKCCYCQNWDIAMHPGVGRKVDPKKMADTILERHLQGLKNVNFVGGNPDPNLYTILKIIKEVDLNIAMVWNSNMFTSRESMKLLDGVMDLYLGDFRYGNNDCAMKYSRAPNNYFEVVSRNFKEAFGQADVILRHLVLPHHIECCTEEVMKWVSRNIPGVYFNLMFQYRPCYQAPTFPEINRLLTLEERQKAIEIGKNYGVNLS